MFNYASRLIFVCLGCLSTASHVALSPGIGLAHLLDPDLLTIQSEIVWSTAQGGDLPDSESSEQDKGSSNLSNIESRSSTSSTVSLEGQEDSQENLMPMPPSSLPRTQPHRVWLRWALWVMILSIAGGGLYQLGRWSGRRELQRSGLGRGRSPSRDSSNKVSDPSSSSLSTASVKGNSIVSLSSDKASHEASNGASDSGHESSSALATTLPIEQTTRLAKINILDELIHDLHSADSTKRRRAIWDLGQQGNSDAIQPLSDLLIDSDSSQRSLILAAMSEIGVRSLKPLNRALMISLQDENPDVRRNAIRDVTRIYDLVTQISHVLHHAVYDEDEEVQETAQWALGQMDRIRGLDHMSHALVSDSSPRPESLPEGSNQSY